MLSPVLTYSFGAAGNPAAQLQPRHAPSLLVSFFFNDPPTTELYTLSLHDALPISVPAVSPVPGAPAGAAATLPQGRRSEEHTSELQSRGQLVCRLLLEKKNLIINQVSNGAAGGLALTALTRHTDRFAHRAD